MKTKTDWIPAGTFLLALVIASVAGPRSNAQDRPPGRETYLKSLFDRLIIDSTPLGGSTTSPDKPSESLGLNFTKLLFDYTAQDNKGNPPPPPPKPKGWWPWRISAVDRLFIEGVYRNKNNPAQIVTLQLQVDKAQETADLPGPVQLSSTLSFTLDEGRRALKSGRSQAAEALGIPSGDVELVTSLNGGDTFFVQFVAEASVKAIDLVATPVVRRFQVTLSPNEDDAVIIPL